MITPDRYQELVDAVAAALNDDSTFTPNSILALSTGGFPVATSLAKRLGIPSRSVVGMPVCGDEHDGYHLDDALVQLGDCAGRAFLVVDDASNRGLLTKQAAEEITRRGGVAKTCVLIANANGDRPDYVGATEDGKPPRFFWEEATVCDLAHDDARTRAIEAWGDCGNRLIEFVDAVDATLSNYAIAATAGVALPNGIDRRRRATMRMCALACQGETGRPLTDEVIRALEADVTPEELVEALMHTIPYAGIPRPLNAILATKDVLAQRALLPVTLREPTWVDSDRTRVGEEHIARAHPTAADVLQENLRPIAASLYDYIVAAAFGDIYARPGLSYAQRQPITIVALMTQGRVANHLRTHINGALNIGMAPVTIVGAVVDTLGIVEPEKVTEALAVATEVFAERSVDVGAPACTW